MDGQIVAAEGAAPAAQAAPAGASKEFFNVDGVMGRIFSMETANLAIRVVLALIVGFAALGIVVAIIKRAAGKRLDTKTGALIVKAIQYVGSAIIIINAFEVAKIDLSALLGAAGIAGIAIGFAAQTSVSNFISGLFLMSEKTFAIGDIVTVESTTGVIYSINALSVKIRTFDNQLVRIPNETLIKTKVTNISAFPVRRLNIAVSVVHGTDIEKAREALRRAADGCPAVLKSPEPFFMVSGINKDGIDLFFGAWFALDDQTAANNGMYEGITRQFAESGIAFARQALSVEVDSASSR